MSNLIKGGVKMDTLIKGGNVMVTSTETAIAKAIASMAYHFGAEVDKDFFVVDAYERNHAYHVQMVASGDTTSLTPHHSYDFAYYGRSLKFITEYWTTDTTIESIEYNI